MQDVEGVQHRGGRLPQRRGIIRRRSLSLSRVGQGAGGREDRPGSCCRGRLLPRTSGETTAHRHLHDVMNVPFCSEPRPRTLLYVMVCCVRNRVHLCVSDRAHGDG